MNIDINNLGYGNPSQEHLKLAGKTTELIVEHDIEFPPAPKNSSPYVFGELLGLVELQKQYLDEPFLEFVEEADEDLEELYEDFLNENSIEFDYYKRLFEDLSILAIRLKIKHNRMRPFQLAKILNVPLLPMNSKSAHSSSYPSGHTLQSYVVSEIIAEHHPQLATKARRLAGMVALSRMVGGWHYPSDNEASFMIGVALMPRIRRPERSECTRM